MLEVLGSGTGDGDESAVEPGGESSRERLAMMACGG